MHDIDSRLSTITSFVTASICVRVLSRFLMRGRTEPQVRRAVVAYTADLSQQGHANIRADLLVMGSRGLKARCRPARLTPPPHTHMGGATP